MFAVRAPVGVDSALTTADSVSRDLARSQSEIAEAAHTEAALKDQLERQRQQAAEQVDALHSELATTRQHWESRLAAASSEAHRLSRALVDTQRQLQLANGRFEASVQHLQHSVLTCFQQSIEQARLSPPAGHGGGGDPAAAEGGDPTAQAAGSSPRSRHGSGGGGGTRGAGGSPGGGGGGSAYRQQQPPPPSSREGIPIPRGAEAAANPLPRSSPGSSPSGGSRTPSRSSSREGGSFGR